MFVPSVQLAVHPYVPSGTLFSTKYWVSSLFMFVLVCSIFQLPDTFVHSEQLNLVAWSSVTLYFKVTGRVYRVVVVVGDVEEVDVKDVEDVEEVDIVEEVEVVVAIQVSLFK